MSEFHSLSGALPHIPDNLSIPQFILDTQLSIRPYRPQTTPWLIDNDTGRALGTVELSERTHGLANALRLKYNIGKNDVVCIFSPNDVDYGVAVWAVHRVGGIVTPANPNYTADELLHQLQITSAAFIITQPGSLSIATSAARRAGLSQDRIVLLGKSKSETHTTVNDLVTFGSRKAISYVERRYNPGETKKAIAFLSFSSGTTGKPKAVTISHYAVIANVIQMATHYKVNDPSVKDPRISPGDVAIAVLPFFHIYGLVVNLHFLLFCGMTIVVLPKFNFPMFLKSIVRHRITHLFLVPPQVVLMCKHPSAKDFDFSHVKFCISGAAPLSGELMEQFSKVLPNASIGQGYGLTETCTSVAMLPPTQKLATVGSAGQLLPGVVARIVKPDGSLAAEGEQGELVIKGPSLASGYFNNEQATKETFIDGWVRTGDEVIVKNGEIYVVDRIKEIMKVRGFQVAPAELEGHLLMHPDVSDACVVSLQDEYSGEIPLAYVVVNAMASERIKSNAAEALKLKTALLKHVSDVKVQYKWLTGGIEFIDVIPKNPSGKMLRRLLRDQARKRNLNSEAGTRLAKL